MEKFKSLQQAVLAVQQTNERLERIEVVLRKLSEEEL